LTEDPPVIYSQPGNLSDFTLCLRFKIHYQRPEYVLFSAYSLNKTVAVMGKLGLSNTLWVFQSSLG